LLYHRHHPLEFILERHSIRPRSTRFSTDIDQVGALINQTKRLADCMVRRQKLPTIRE